MSGTFRLGSVFGPIVVADCGAVAVSVLSATSVGSSYHFTPESNSCDIGLVRHVANTMQFASVVSIVSYYT